MALTKPIVRFIVSDSIETQMNGTMQRQVLINPVLNVKVPFVPTNLSFSITILVAKISSGDHQIEVKLKQSDNSNIVFDSGIGNVNIPDDSSEFTANVDLRNLTIPASGDYIIEFTIDNHEPFTETFGIIETKQK